MGLDSSSCTYRYKDFNNGSICLCNEDGKVISDGEADADSTRKIVFGSNGGAITSKGQIWCGVSATLSNVGRELTDGARTSSRAHWHGDAAEKAHAQLSKLRDTARLAVGEQRPDGQRAADDGQRHQRHPGRTTRTSTTTTRPPRGRR